MNFKYDHIVTFLWVKNWDTAINFYSQTLGFNKTYESEGWAEFNIPGLKDVYFAINRWNNDESIPQNHFITFRVSNLDNFLKHLKEHNVKITSEIEEFIEEGQGLRMFKFSDPDGNILTASEII